MELALACRYRVGVDDGRLTLGLPEVQLGIHPGFGGTVRAESPGPAGSGATFTVELPRTVPEGRAAVRQEN